MAYNVKEIVANKPSRFTAGHRMCAGCGAPPIARHIMRALKPEDHAVVAGATRVYGSFYFYLPLYRLDRFFYSYCF